MFLVCISPIFCATIHIVWGIMYMSFPTVKFFILSTVNRYVVAAYSIWMLFYDLDGLDCCVQGLVFPAPYVNFVNISKDWDYCLSFTRFMSVFISFF